MKFSPKFGLASVAAARFSIVFFATPLQRGQRRVLRVRAAAHLIDDQVDEHGL